MVAWWWLPIAFVVGAILGVFIFGGIVFRSL